MTFFTYINSKSKVSLVLFKRLDIMSAKRRNKLLLSYDQYFDQMQREIRDNTLK
jgi:hypothetical protein